MRTSAAVSPRCSARPRSASTISSGSRACRPRSCSPSSWSSSSPASSRAMAAAWCRLYDPSQIRHHRNAKSGHPNQSSRLMPPRPFALALLAALLVPAAAQAQGTAAPKATTGAAAQRPAAAAQAQSAANAPGAAAVPGAPVQVPPAFVTFLQELWPDARAKGVTRATFDLAFAGVVPDPRIMPITQRQPEFGQSVGTYIANFASKSRIETGIRKAAEHATTLEAVEREYGVDRFLVLAIWGVETNYGNMRDR